MEILGPLLLIAGSLVMVVAVFGGWMRQVDINARVADQLTDLERRVDRLDAWSHTEQKER